MARKGDLYDEYDPYANQDDSYDPVNPAPADTRYFDSPAQDSSPQPGPTPGPFTDKPPTPPGGDTSGLPKRGDASDDTWWNTVGQYQAQMGGGGGNQQTAVMPYRLLDYSAQPIQQTLGPQFSALTDLLQQMFASQQQRDSENAQYRNSVRAQIQGRLSGLSTPRSMSDADLAAQSRAFKGGSDRALRQNREAMAERAHAQGIPSGAVDANLQSSITRSGQNQGAFDAGILGKALTEQKDEIDRLLQMSAGIMSSDEMASLQAHRDQIQGQLQSLSTQQSGLLGQGELDLRQLLGLGSLDLQQQGLGLQGQQIGNQNSQFYDRLGLDLGNDEFMHKYLLQQLLGQGGA